MNIKLIFRSLIIVFLCTPLIFSKETTTDNLILAIKRSDVNKLENLIQSGSFDKNKIDEYLNLAEKITKDCKDNIKYGKPSLSDIVNGTLFLTGGTLIASFYVIKILLMSSGKIDNLLSLLRCYVGLDSIFYGKNLLSRGINRKKQVKLIEKAILVKYILEGIKS